MSVSWRDVMYGPGAAAETKVARAERVQPTGKANRLAVTALVCSALAPILAGGILGIVFGLVALNEIAESEGKERGEGMAHWAIGLGVLNVILSCAFIALLIVVFI